MFAESLTADIDEETDDAIAERTLFSLVIEVEGPTGDPDETLADDISIHLINKIYSSTLNFSHCNAVVKEKNGIPGAFDTEKHYFVKTVRFGSKGKTIENRKDFSNLALNDGGQNAHGFFRQRAGGNTGAAADARSGNQNGFILSVNV